MKECLTDSKPAEKTENSEQQFTGIVDSQEELQIHLTQTNRLRQDLAALENLLTAALTSSNAGLWDWTIGRERIFFSASYYLMLGYAPCANSSELSAWIDCIHPEDYRMVRERFSALIGAGREKIEMEFRVNKCSGASCWVLLRGCVVEWDDARKPVRLVGTVIDITDKKRWEEALKESERRLSTLLHSLPGMAYRCTKTDEWKMEFVSEGCTELTGYAPTQLIENRALYTNLIHPEDRKKVWDEVENAILEKRNYEMFYRIRTAKNIDRWVWEQGTGVYDENGNFIAIEGFTSDVTAYKKAEQDLQKKNLRLKAIMQNSRTFGNIIGESREMQGVYDMILQAAESSASVIIYGESGTGKELVAHAVHEMSDRGDKEIVCVNCGAIPDALLESEFFGYRKGAFTGANIDKLGYLDIADGGTLFLDEIGEIKLSMQVKLLRAIEGGGYTPIGGSKVKRPDIRIISATNRDLKALVRQGIMRQDFFYRIHVIPIRLPPLRERRRDIPLLIYHFLQKFSDENNIATIPGDIIRDMQAYDWPGNIRELQNTVQRFVTLKKVDLIGPKVYGIFDSNHAGPARQSCIAVPNDPSLQNVVQKFEKQYIEEVLARNDGNRTRTAKMLKVGIRTLQRKIKEHDIH
ncbi:sigma 54-interacting transcriptional regulator [Desulfococcus sp.]|uniref:sigma 54-interacting transcriptional regulator n=1 Tax=Desulfococcus sp. TaxID=2025834 RepID=UPI0035940DB8